MNQLINNCRVLPLTLIQSHYLNQFHIPHNWKRLFSSPPLADEKTIFNQFNSILTEKLAQNKNLNFNNSSPIALGFSGGIDSSALLLLLANYIATSGHKGQIHIVQVNHKLRKESTEETIIAANMIEKIKKQMGFKSNEWCHTILNIDWNNNPPNKSHIQSTARNHRYKLFHDYCTKNSIQFLFLAHHLDDLCETVLFRYSRCSGLYGLNGMKTISKRNNLFIIRPLLTINKPKLQAICLDYNCNWIEDSSNINPIFDRVRMRQVLQSIKITSFKEELLRNVFNIVQKTNYELENKTESLMKQYVQFSAYDESALISVRDLFSSPIPIPLITILFQTVTNKIKQKPNFDSYSEMKKVVQRLKSQPLSHRIQVNGCILESSALQLKVSQQVTT